MKIRPLMAGTAFLALLTMTGCGQGNNTANDAGNAVGNVANATGNAIGNTANAVGNATNTGGNATNNTP